MVDGLGIWDGQERFTLYGQGIASESLFLWVAEARRVDKGLLAW